MAKNVFNPVKETEKGSRVVWSTAAINLAIEALDKGKRLKANPFLDGNIKLLKPDIIFEHTDEEIEKWKYYSTHIEEFVEDLCKVMTPKGYDYIKLRDYQKEYFSLLDDNRLTILLSARQIGKTITSALYILHYLCFNTDKNCIVIGNRGKTAREVLSKIKDIFEELPHWVKPGVSKWNETEVAFDNGCRIITDTTTEKPALGFTLHLCLWDEAAHVRESIATEFYANLFPTLQAANGKMMITSTQNGYNLFYRLYKAAEAGESSYKAFKVDWDRVPEWDPDKKIWYKRDEAWRQRQIANLGSEESFNSQFGTSFDIASNTLISRNKLKKIQGDVYEFVEKDMPGVPSHSYWMWHPDVDPMDLNTPIAITCDLSEGVGGDYTVFLVWDIHRCECIGFFRANTLSREECALSLMKFIVICSKVEKTLLSFERNTYGDVFLKAMDEIIEANNIEFDKNIIAKYYNDSGTRWAYGIKITSSNKPKYALLFKDAFERGKIINKSTVFVNEILNFIDKGDSRFSSSYGNDDMVMASIQLMFAQDTIRWKMLKDYVGEEKVGNLFDF